MNTENEQFTQIPHSLMSNKDLTDQDKLTLGLILSFIKNNKECYMGNEYIAEKMGITKNAASIRIKRLEKLGCISLRYTYKENKKEVDKRYITLLSLTPQVSSTTRDVSSDRQGGIVPQTIGYCPTDNRVSCKQGGIIQPDYTIVLDNELDKITSIEKNEKINLEDQCNNISSSSEKYNLKNLICRKLNLTTKQFFEHIENRFENYSNKLVLEQNKQLIEDYFKN
jgi:DNA-binding MarR family transcriptional regulator